MRLQILVLTALALFSLVSRADDVPNHMSYLDNGTIRLGVDLDLGGAITWLSKSGEPANLVNSWDWGRQIQMSFYSGPVPFIPEGKEVAPHWRELGWNPIQVGDHFKNRSKLLEHHNDGHEIFVRCTPMQWPLNNVPGDCIFESRLTLDGATVHASCRLINQRQDLTQYPARAQELPALYTNGPWWRLMTYTGDKPFTDDALTQIPAKMPWTMFHPTENWAALVNDQNWGVGVWAPGVYRFGGGFAGKPGAGGPHDSPAGYIAPHHIEILDHDIDYTYSYVLILGSLDEIRHYVSTHATRPAPPAYRFDKDRQHWYFHDAADTGWPVHGELDIHLTGKTPMLLSAETFFQSADAPRAYIEAAFQTTNPTARLRWRTPGENFSEDKTKTFTITPDGQYHIYEVDLSSSPAYHGPITALRLDPTPVGGPAERVRIKSISFTRPNPDK